MRMALVQCMKQFKTLVELTAGILKGVGLSQEDEGKRNENASHHPPKAGLSVSSKLTEKYKS